MGNDQLVCGSAHQFQQRVGIADRNCPTVHIAAGLVHILAVIQHPGSWSGSRGAIDREDADARLRYLLGQIGAQPLAVDSPSSIAAYRLGHFR